MKIKTLTLTDFRAFPGPAPVPFELAGKNLLVYGENGAGKSSIFYALREFFAFKTSKPLLGYKNVFSGEPDSNCSVAVDFMDGTPPVKWSTTQHPCSRLVSRGDPRVKDAALRRACLDYRSVLDTNYLHGDNEINLFPIAVSQLVHDFPVTVAGGGSRTVGELWQDVKSAKPSTHYSTSFIRVNEACVNFNAGFNQALTALYPPFTTLLGELLGTDVAISPFLFPGVTYASSHFQRDRKFNGQELKLEIQFKGHQPDRPQNFLNEARLSALGLAIYLAGRLAFTPSASSPSLKLLVLDDVLIGLDHSNRLPVLDVLKKNFSDWQVVLLTHDRVWFEMAKMYLDTNNHWKSIELFESVSAAGYISPIVKDKRDENAVEGFLTRAREHLTNHDLNAAANYARSAFEWVLKSFCQRHKVQVAYKLDSKHMNTEDLLKACEGWADGSSTRKCFCGVFNRIRMFRGVVLNPFSHSAPVSLARSEVLGAIDAVKLLHDVLDPKNTPTQAPLESASTLLTQPTQAPELTLAAVGYLRAAFTSSLHAYSERMRIEFPYSSKSLSNKKMWDKAKINLTHPIAPSIITKIEPHRSLLIDDLTDAVISGINFAAAKAALTAIEITGNPGKTILD